MTKPTFSLTYSTETDSDVVTFIPQGDRVEIMSSHFGEPTWKKVEQAREEYRLLRSLGWLTDEELVLGEWDGSEEAGQMAAENKAENAWLVAAEYDEENQAQLALDADLS